MDSTSSTSMIPSQKSSTNQLVGPMLTDFYQITMAYAYWKGGRADDEAVFEIFFRKIPFGGEFCIFAGLDEVLKFVSEYRFDDSDIEYLRNMMPQAEEAFWVWLKSLDCSKVKLFSMRQGEVKRSVSSIIPRQGTSVYPAQVVFPRQPLIRVEGPLGIAQLLETTLLNLVNFASLVATNAARMRIAANSKFKRMLPEHEGQPVDLLEFGLRRAQGPDGGISASKYSYLGGFSGTSNVLAGKLFNIALRGTHAHAFVMSYNAREDLKSTTIKTPAGTEVDFYELVMAKRKILGYDGTIGNTSYGELLAFIAYAQSNPGGFVALVDTYDTLSSGVPNFLIVGLALRELGYHPVGIRLDSGDLSYLSKETRKLFMSTDARINSNVFSGCKIVASNDIDEKMILSLNTEGHEIDVLAVGTRLVTCYNQPALGCVYKLVEINGKPRIKLSQETEKMVIPSRKAVYRLIGKEDRPIIDIMMLESEPPPLVDHKILCRHPFMESKRAFVTPSKVIPLLHLVWNCKDGVVQSQPSLEESRRLCWENIQRMREDHIRPMNATPYKVSLSSTLFEFFHQLIQSETPIADLS